MYFFFYRKEPTLSSLILGHIGDTASGGAVFCAKDRLTFCLSCQCDSAAICFRIVLHLMLLFNNPSEIVSSDVVLTGHKIKYIIKEKWNWKKHENCSPEFSTESQLLIKDEKKKKNAQADQSRLPFDLKIYETGWIRVGGRGARNHFQLLVV